MRITISILLLASALAGCGQNNSSHEEKPMAAEDTVYGPAVKDLERAENTAREMEGRVQDLNKQLENAEGTSDQPAQQ